MTLRRAFTAVIASGIICGILGGVIGYLIGMFAPTAYRGLFAWGASEEFSPVEFGTGLGIAQGLLAGIALGVVLVGLVTWYEIRALAGKKDEDEPRSGDCV